MQEGLIFAFLLDGQGGGKRLTWQQVNRWTPDKGELWLHFDYSVYQTKEWLFNDAGLNLAVAETLLSSESRPRFSQLDDGSLMAWRGVNLNPNEEPDDMVAVRLWHDEHRLITTLKRDLSSINELVEMLERQRGALNLGQLMIEMADKLIEHISDIVNDYEDQMALLEEQVIEESSAKLRTELSQLRRQVISLRRYMTPQKEALMRFSMEKLAWMNQQERIALREVVDRITKELEDLEALRERAVVAQEELQNRLSEQLNSRMYLLSIITAVFLPLGFLTGLLGVNVGGIPGAENPQAFRYFVWIVVGLIVVQLVIFKWRKWF
ncbi:zinc transporter ZntB [Thiosulfatimonas sediminis]|uniref:Zinc transporter ZntB n=1 Tax=Thiosulfatimonas sediminis TaxID=2675054 RepID=A0A6F8PSJ5_9GAMM|nr:zinc transporter ZntB [Thiosulfatimonas sediminis]BBP44960.1 zinc transporter ZntB [Thiosulfatimonas sediminis]